MQKKFLEASAVIGAARFSKVLSHTLQVRVSGEFREDVWDPLVKKLGDEVVVTQIMKEAICARAALELEDAKVIIRMSDGTEQDLKKFLGIKS